MSKWKQEKQKGRKEKDKKQRESRHRLAAGDDEVIDEGFMF